MNDDAVKETFDELFTLLEGLEAQSSAILQCLKEQGITSDEKLGPYLEQAGKASNVKWRAARMRMEYLFSPTKKGAGAVEKKEPRENRDKADDKQKDTKQDETPNGQKAAAAEEQKDGKERANEHPADAHSDGEANAQTKAEGNKEPDNRS